MRSVEINKKFKKLLKIFRKGNILSIQSTSLLGLYLLSKGFLVLCYCSNIGPLTKSMRSVEINKKFKKLLKIFREEATSAVAGFNVGPLFCSNWTLEMLIKFK